MSLTPRSHLNPDFGARIVTSRDQPLAAVITLHWSTRRVALASIMGVTQTVLARAVKKTTLDPAHRVG